MRARPWQPSALIAGLLLAPLPFACGGSTIAPDDVADDGGDEFTFPHPEAGVFDVAPRLDTGLAETGPVGPSSQPPGPPSAPATIVATEHNFAVHTLYMGDSPRGSATQSTTAWKNFGFNIDGKISTRTSTDVCTVVAGASAIVHDNGTGGIDNSFGANILPVLLSTGGSSFATGINQTLTTGQATLLFDTIGLTDDAAQTNTGLTAQVFSGGTFAGTPTFTVSDNWPVTSASLFDGATIAGGAKTKFATAYVVGGTWVNGSTGDVAVRLVSAGIEIDLVIHHAIVSFNHSAATKATNGTIAGVLNTEEFITMFKGVAGRISTELCSGATLDAITTQLRQASDILSDGTNAPGSTCDGISIGLGFDADQIAPPSTVSPPTDPVPDPCP